MTSSGFMHMSGLCECWEICVWCKKDPMQFLNGLYLDLYLWDRIDIKYTAWHWMNSSHMAPTYDLFLFRELHFKCHWMFFLLKMSHPIHYCHTVLFQVTLDSYLVHWGSESWKCRLPLLNEMVSTGDTAISLHIRTPWNSGGGGGCNPDKLKLKVPRYAQIFIFRRIGGGGLLLTNSNSKCQDLHKFSFWGWGTPDKQSWNTWVGALKEFWTKNSGNWNM